MKDFIDVEPENVLLVNGPKYTKIGVDLEYYVDGYDHWIPCKLHSFLDKKYRVTFSLWPGYMDVSLNTIRLRPSYSME
jgi:hypothetical protein